MEQWQPQSTGDFPDLEGFYGLYTFHGIPWESWRALGSWDVGGNHISADRIPGNLTLPNCPRSLCPSLGDGQTVTTVQKRTILVIKDLAWLVFFPTKKSQEYQEIRKTGALKYSLWLLEFPSCSRSDSLLEASL